MSKRASDLCHLLRREHANLLGKLRRQPNVVGIQDHDNAVTLILDRNAFLTKRRLEPNTKAYNPCPLEDIARGLAIR